MYVIVTYSYNNVSHTIAFFIYFNKIIIIIQEDLLKINKNMLKLIQLFTSAWRNIILISTYHMLTIDNITTYSLLSQFKITVNFHHVTAKTYPI